MANIKELMHSSFQQSLSLFSNKDTYDYYDYDYGYYSKEAWFRQPLVRWSIYSETIKHAFHEENYTNGKDFLPSNTETSAEISHVSPVYLVALLNSILENTSPMKLGTLAA